MIVKLYANDDKVHIWRRVWKFIGIGQSFGWQGGEDGKVFDDVALSWRKEGGLSGITITADDVSDADAALLAEDAGFVRHDDRLQPVERSV